MAGRSSLEDRDPLRTALLARLRSSGEAMSPVELAQELGVPISRTRYQLAVLATAGKIWVVRSEQIGDACVPFYRPRTL